MATAQQQKELDYLNQTYQGGSSAYIASQIERARQAQASGDTNLLSRLQEDAQRVGYSIPNEHQAYLDNTYQGGSSAYIASQIERARQAQASGDAALLGRLQADAQRVGYTIPQAPTQTPAAQPMAAKSAPLASSNPTPQPTYQAPQSYASQITDYYAQQQNAQRQSLQNRISNQVNTVERQRIGLAPMYQQERSDADAQAIVAGRRLSEIMEARGLGQSGENITANVGLQSARQNAFANIGQRETTANAQLNQQIADLRTAGAGDISQMEAALAADRTGALLQDIYRQNSEGRDDYRFLTNFNYQAGRDKVGDARYDQQWNYNVGRDQVADKRYADEITWARSENNPAYRRQLLDNMITEMQMANLPEQYRLQLEKAKQDLSLGNANYDRIRADIQQIQAQTAQIGKETEKEDKTVQYYVDQAVKLYPASAFQNAMGQVDHTARQRALYGFIANMQGKIPDAQVAQIMMALGLE